MKEKWKDIKGYERLYQVSNLGRVKSLSKFHRISKEHSSIGYMTKEKILKQVRNSRGYLRVSINKKRYFTHRLVAEAFIPNPKNKPCVNHLDCNPLNNNADNLEWCTQQENVDYMIKLGRNIRTNEWNKNRNNSLKKYYKKVVGTNKITGKVISFSSIQEAGRNGFNASDICNCCQGKRKSAGGYRWEYDRQF